MWSEIVAIYRASKKRRDINWFTELVARPPAAVVVYALRSTPITPNQVTFLSAVIAGLAGATKALVVQNASLTDVSFSTSGEVVLMTLVGGMGTFYGPVVGALIVVAMQNYLAQFGEWVTVIQGVVFVACVLAFRRGIVGELAARAKVSL